MTSVDAIISKAHKDQFHQEGYFILEGVLQANQLTLLQETCQDFVTQANVEMDKLGVDVIGINHRNQRYFLQTFQKTDRLHPVIFSSLMADICKATLGDNAYLFLDQYVVKAAEKGLKFSWHQDSGYIPYAHRPYITCWCALDDVNEQNGTIYVLPYSKVGTKEVITHLKDAGTNDLVGYFGNDPGLAIIAPAGSMVVFSSTLLHRSGYNFTNQTRRAWLAQYSAEPILNEDGSGLRYFAEPFLQNGTQVRS